MTETCFLCRVQLSNSVSSNYNIDLNFTKCTNKLLRTHLEDIFENSLVLTTNLLICTNCNVLLNDLDFAQNSFKRLRNTVWNYLGYNVVTPSKSNVYCQTDEPTENHFQQVSLKKDCISSESDMKIEEIVTQHIENDNDVGKSKKSNGMLHKNDNILKPHQCPLCPKTWRTLGELKSHITSHSDVRPFICEVCGQSYKHKSALDIHVGMHNGIYPFVCMYCKKNFTQKGALQRHLPIHTGETPYQCDLCGKRFVHHTSFNIHQLSHTGQKHYKCAQCGLALLSGSHLKRHMRVHTGEKKYACNLCDKRFAERYNLASHQKLHGKTTSDNSCKRNHRCSLCTETFNRRLKLDEHVVQAHQKIVQNLY